MPIDPQIQALLDKGTGVPATHTLPVDVARAQYEARIALMAPPAEIAQVARADDRRAGRAAAPAHLHAARHRALPAARVLSRQRFCAVQPRYS